MGFFDDLWDGITGQSGAKAAREAAAAQERQAREAVALQDKIYNENVARMEPFRQVGLTATNKLPSIIDENPYLKPFGTDQFVEDPGYKYRLATTLKYLDRISSQRGGLLSGAGIAAGEKAASDMASQEWQNAFNRYMTQGQNYTSSKIAPYLSLTQLGSGTASNIGSLGANYASGATNSLEGIGNAQAAGIVGANNALQQGNKNIFGALLGQYSPYAQTGNQQTNNQQNNNQGLLPGLISVFSKFSGGA